jgi:hypothetical protein
VPCVWVAGRRRCADGEVQKVLVETPLAQVPARAPAPHLARLMGKPRKSPGRNAKSTGGAGPGSAEKTQAIVPTAPLLAAVVVAAATAIATWIGTSLTTTTTRGGGTMCVNGTVEPAWSREGGGGDGGLKKRGNTVYRPVGRRCVTLTEGWKGWATDGFLRQEPGQGRKAQDQEAMNSVNFSVLWGALSEAETADIVRAARKVRIEPRSYKDSIDGKAAFERYILNYGKVQEPEFYTVVEPFATKVITPYVQQQYPDAELCYILLRVYRKGERLGVELHRDVAYVSTPPCACVRTAP